MTSASARTFADVAKPPLPAQQREPVEYAPHHPLQFIFRLNTFFVHPLRLYAKYGKMYFGTPFNWVRKKLSIRCPASSAVITAIFTDVNTLFSWLAIPN